MLHPADFIDSEENNETCDSHLDPSPEDSNDSTTGITQIENDELHHKENKHEPEIIISVEGQTQTAALNNMKKKKLQKKIQSDNDKGELFSPTRRKSNTKSSFILFLYMHLLVMGKPTVHLNRYVSRCV